MRTTPRIKGLYAVTPDSTDTALLLEQVLAAIEGGAALVQYRNKPAGETLRREQASALLALCRRRNVPLIINDHLDLCLAIDADGLHLGGTDGDIAAARSQLGTDRILGVSCYDRFELAVQAKDMGADYVAFGSCFPSATKPAAVRAPLHLFGLAKRPGVAVVAIGNARQCCLGNRRRGRRGRRDRRIVGGCGHSQRGTNFFQPFHARQRP